MEIVQWISVKMHIEVIMSSLYDCGFASILLQSAIGWRAVLPLYYPLFGLEQTRDIFTQHISPNKT
jgi:hypothetical protein